MTIKKILLSLVLVTVFALSMISCGGTKNICPAYSNVKTETTVHPNS